MATSPNTLEYVISIIFNQGQVRSATQAMDALEQKALNNVNAMKKLGSGNKEIERSYSDATQKINGIMTPLVALTQKFRDNKGVITETTRYYEKHGRTVQEMTSLVEVSTNTMGKHTQSIGAMAAGFAKLALRAAVVVPIWMIIRTIFGTVQKLITDSITTWLDLSKEMARVGSTGFEAAQNLKLLKNVILDFSRNSSRGFKEAAAAMYQLGSAGLSVTEMIQGMPHIMNLAIASFANTEQTAKLVAGAYNVFGDSMEGTFTISEKFKYISDMLTYTYAKQQVELEDLSNAMSYVASAAGLMHIDFGTLVTTVGVLNTGMLKGSKAGVALMNSFIQIAQQSSKLADLNVAFDPSKPLDFVDVVDQLHTKYGNAALSLTNLKEIMDIFGQRGGRAMAQLISDYDRWKSSINDARASYKDFAEEMRQVAEKSLPAAWEKMWNSMKANMISSLSGTEEFLTNLFNKIGANLQRGAFFKEFKQYLTPEQISTFETGTGAEKDTLIKRLEASKQIWEIEKQVRTELEAQRNHTKKRTEEEKTLESVVKSVMDRGGSEVDLQKELIKYVQDAYQTYQLTDEELAGIVQKLADSLKLQKDLNAAPLTFTKTEVKGFRDVENAAKYEMMRAGGAKDSAVAYAELNDLVTNANIEIKHFNDVQNENVKNGKQQVAQQRNYLNMQEIITSSSYDNLLVLKQVGGEEADINKIVQKRAELVQKLYADQMEYAQKLRSDMSSIFKDVLLGEDTIGNMGKRIGDSMRTNIAEAIANSLSTGLLQTGLGEQFGAMGAAFENMFSGPGGMFSSAIVQGSKAGSPSFKEQILDGSKEGAPEFKKQILEGTAESIAMQEKAKIQTTILPPGGGGGGATISTIGQTIESMKVEESRATAKSRIYELRDEIKNAQAGLDQSMEEFADLRSGKTQVYKEGKLQPAGQELINEFGAMIAEQKRTLKDLQQQLGDQYALATPQSTIDRQAQAAYITGLQQSLESDRQELADMISGKAMTLKEGGFQPVGQETIDALKSSIAESEKGLALAVKEAAEKGTAFGAEKGAQIGAEAGVSAGAPAIATALSGLFSGLSGGGGGAAGVFGATGIFGAAGAASGLFQTPIGGTAGLTKLASGKYKTASGKPAATYGDLFGGAVTGAAMGYSQYQSMTARGVNPGYAAASGGLMGLGAFLTYGGMASGQFWLAGVGMMMMAAGYLMDAFKKGKSQTTVSESSRTEQKQVTSRIDITNKQLEVVNRNLVAMRDDLTYIMQSSYYFRERNVEDRFAIDSQRGNM